MKISRIILFPLIVLARLFGLMSQSLDRTVPNQKGPYNADILDWYIAMLSLVLVLLVCVGAAALVMLPAFLMAGK